MSDYDDEMGRTGNILIDSRNEREAFELAEAEKFALLSPQEQYQQTRTVTDKYGVPITYENQVDLTKALEYVDNILAKANVQTGQLSTKIVNSFSRDLLALQASHKSYMDRLNEQMVEAPEINWAERVSVLGQKARADYAAGDEKKIGRMETIVTSPLLDETDPVTTKNILGGS